MSDTNKLTVEHIRSIMSEWINIESYYDDEKGFIIGLDEAAKEIHEAVYSNKDSGNGN